MHILKLNYACYFTMFNILHAIHQQLNKISRTNTVVHAVEISTFWTIIEAYIMRGQAPFTNARHVLSVTAEGCKVGGGLSVAVL